MNYDKIGKIPLFRGLDADHLDRIFERFNLGETKFTKGSILAMQDEPCNRLIILTTGRVKTEMFDHTGRSVKIEELSAPVPLALLFLFGEESRFPVQVTALEDVSAVVLSRQTVLEILGMHRTVLTNYLNLVSVFATRISRKLNLMSFRTIREKLAIYILELSRRSGTDNVVLDRTKSSLAEYFGVTRPSLERELTKMERDGLITAVRRDIEICDKERLASLVRPH